MSQHDANALQTLAGSAVKPSIVDRLQIAGRLDRVFVDGANAQEQS